MLSSATRGLALATRSVPTGHLLGWTARLARRTMLRPTYALITLVLCALPLTALHCSATGDGDGTGGAGTSSSGTGAFGSGGTFGHGGSGGFSAEKCGESTYGNEVPGSLLIVLDKSGSMSDPPEGGSTTKWSSTVAAINSMVVSASPTLEVGLLAYPEGNFDDFALVGCMMDPNGPNCPAILADGGCKDVATAAHVPIEPLSANGAAINSWLGQNSATGNTPTWWALKNGYSILLGYQALGQRFALLMTDGEPTLYTPAFGGFPEMFNDCGGETDIESEVLAAANNGIATFVIGSPGSEGAAPFLSQLAVNGNTPKDPNCTPAAGNCHYQIGTTNFQQELETVLQEIAGVIADCIFDVPQGEDIDPNLVNIVIETPNGPVQIYKDPSHQDGWDYTDPTQTKIQLFGPACDLYKAQTGNTITIILGCQTVLR